MICDALNEDEIYEAFLLYASLHGLNADETTVRERVARYLQTTVDATIDEAVLAYCEDRMVAPPDIVLPRWGKSRVYELEQVGDVWRHRVCEAWFEAGCGFDPLNLPAVCHFWTEFERSQTAVRECQLGDRLRLRLLSDWPPPVVPQVIVTSRSDERLGGVPTELAVEMYRCRGLELRYLPLVDAPSTGPLNSATIRLFVACAPPTTPLDELLDYTQRAFFAVRNKC